ncbi:MAG: cation-transporting P-type ATPase [Alphaproteobacteria bacterium]
MARRTLRDTASAKDRGPDWHDQPVAAVLERLDASADGLDTGAVAARRDRFGPNRMPEAARPSALMRFLRQFDNVLIYVLLGAAGLTAVFGHYVDTGVILAVVVVNAVIGFIQEGKAEGALAAIRDMLAPQATVLRAGRRQAVASEDLVPGDVVLLEAGDRVPADLRMLAVRGLRINEAVLTGESLPVEKDPEPVPAGAALGDQRSMAFSGTIVAAGQGRGVAVATGAATEIGKISKLIASVTTIETPLLRQMAVFSKWLTAFILGVSALIVLYGLTLGGFEFTKIFMIVVGLAVAAIPEGLPAILTVTLAIGVEGMARRNAIVRRLPAIEALGSVSVICSDKTGTLTRNEMMVASVVTPSRSFIVSGSGYAPDGALCADGADVHPAEDPLLTAVVTAGLLCNEADLVQCGAQGWSVRGDPMEGALLALGHKAGLIPEDARGALPRTDTIPFDSSHRFMATLHHDHEGHGVIYVKGAPERLLAMCRFEGSEMGERVDLERDRWQAVAAEIAARGERVLAVAMREVSVEHTTLSFRDVEEGLTLIGLVGLIDPPREEAIRAVADCRSAGIRVKMITGDHAGTASAIARKLGLENPGAVLEGTDIDRLDDEALKAKVSAVDVFARTTPEHKLRLVEALQAQGAVVAMTGDGVNDAPALKRADIGVAMGGKGTEAAKEAAEIVLADDNFATVAQSVRAGRVVYDNLKKAITFLLPVNGGESVSLVLAILFGLTLPITPVQILWVNMVSSVLLAMTLAFEPAEPDIMRRPPRAGDEPILSGLVLWRVAFVSALFCAGIFGKFALAQAQGAGVEEARTVAVNTLVVMEIFYLFSVRYLNNPSLTLTGVLGTRPVLLAVSAVAMLQGLFTYAPFMEAFFDTRPLSPMDALQILAVGVAFFLVLEAEKRIRRRVSVRIGPASIHSARTKA